MCEITSLKDKLDAHLKTPHQYESLENKLSATENRVQENGNNVYILIHAVDDLEKAVQSLQIQTGQREPPVACNFCGKLFPNETILRFHLSTEHKV